MRILSVLLLIPLLLWNCGSEQELQQDNEPAKSEYTLTINSSVFGVYVIEGTETLWDPFLGHMELGPDDLSCACPCSPKPIGSLWMTLISPENIDPDDDIPEHTFTFYSILNWCNDLGDQESNWYDTVEGNLYEFDKNDFLWEFGVDSEGKNFVRVDDVQLKMTRNLLNDADIPENIIIDLDFTAVE